jgi:hypothetical protein
MDTPSHIFRAVTTLKYAEDFALRGTFRLGNLAHYRSLESDIRADKSEGLGNFINSAGVSELFELGTPKYVLSCSTPNVDLHWLRNRMGYYLIKIDDVLQLMQDIQNYLASQGVRVLGSVSGATVEYSKFERKTDSTDVFERSKLSVLQKPRQFIDENEYRIYALIGGEVSELETPTHITINLGKTLKYVSVVS